MKLDVNSFCILLGRRQFDRASQKSAQIEADFGAERASGPLPTPSAPSSHLKLHAALRPLPCGPHAASGRDTGRRPPRSGRFRAWSSSTWRSPSVAINQLERALTMSSEHLAEAPGDHWRPLRPMSGGQVSPWLVPPFARQCHRAPGRRSAAIPTALFTQKYVDVLRKRWLELTSADDLKPSALG